jgi:hypothetical protein
MKGFLWIVVFLAMVGCNSDDVTWISIRNETMIPIYALPYSSEFTNPGWIQPGVTDDFYSLSCDCIDGFNYFSFYYDSLIVLLEDDQNPIKFYKDGTTINYDPRFNPFTNPEVWHSTDFYRTVEGSAIYTLEEKHVFEYYFCIEQDHVKSLSVEDGSDPGS